MLLAKFSNFVELEGFGGLTAAIECHRQGHEVEIYESFPGQFGQPALGKIAL